MRKEGEQIRENQLREQHVNEHRDGEFELKNPDLRRGLACFKIPPEDKPDRRAAHFFKPRF